MNTSSSKTKSTSSLISYRKSAAERKRKQREKIRQDPEKYARMKEKEKERSRKRREEKKIPSINDLTERGKRKQRAEWRKRYHKHAKNKRKQQVEEEYFDANSLPQSPVSPDMQNELVLDNRKKIKDTRRKSLRKSRENIGNRSKNWKQN